MSTSKFFSSSFQFPPSPPLCCFMLLDNGTLLAPGCFLAAATLRDGIIEGST